MEIFARIQAAAGGNTVPMQPQVIARLGAPFGPNWSAYPTSDLPLVWALWWSPAADRDDWFARLGRAVPSISPMAYERPRVPAILDAAAWEQKNFPGRVVIALRARLGVEWKSLDDLTAVLPAVEAALPAGIDLENYELLRAAERAAALRP